MSIIRRLIAVSSVAILAMVSGTVVAQADSTPSIYNTPGGQVLNGRLWNTTCGKYSSNVVRCRTEIWATSVQYRNGRYVSVTGWTFNNLSYLPSPRSTWTGNNLGQNNPLWTSGGRKWRTECDTAATGRGGCRSYIWSKRVSVANGGYTSDYGWVFNNLVLFSSSSVPAVKTVPGWIIDRSRLDVTGLGPLQVGIPMADLGRLGYASQQANGDCTPWNPSPSLKNRGIDMWAVSDRDSALYLLDVDEPGVLTVDGARVGMTLGEVKAIYGTRIRLETKDGYEPVYTAVVQRDGYELIFFNGFRLDRPLVDSDVITHIMAREIDGQLLWDGC